MSQRSKVEVVEQIRYRYVRATGKAEKGRLIEALCRGCGWERKYAIKVLGRQRGPLAKGKVSAGRHGGPRPRYGAEVVGVLKELWLASDQLCGRRLAPVLGVWLQSWERRHGAVAREVKEKVLQISAAQIDRVLAPFKVRERRRVRPACEVRRQIPLRTGPWMEEGAGWIEADTVAHCGGKAQGSYAWSVVLTDIATGWTEARMSWNRSHLAIKGCIARMEAALPFPVLGFDSDNGGEFINEVLLAYWKQRPQDVKVTRSRPYRKNDNAHIEQKNRVMVRENLGYERIANISAVPAFDEALRLLSLRANLFQAAARLVCKDKSDPSRRPKKVYEKRHRTPWERVMAAGTLTPSQRRALEALREDTDPLTLNDRIEQKLREGWQLNASGAENPACRQMAPPKNFSPAAAQQQGKSRPLKQKQGTATVSFLLEASQAPACSASVSYLA